MSSDIFQEISEENIPKMLDALKQDWPKHYNLFQMVTVLREYKEAGSPILYSVHLHGDYDKGVYLLRVEYLLPTQISVNCYVYTPSMNVPLLKECLEKTEKIHWKKHDMFNMIDSRFSAAIEDVCTSKNMTCHIIPNTMFWYPPEKKLVPKDIPEDLSLEFLDHSFAEEMNRNWPHKFPYSELILEENIRRNFGLGLFKKSDRSLLCSALSMYTGGIFVLYTNPLYRGLGYARLLVERMAMEIRKRNRIPFCTIIKGNKASETTFTRAGYEPLTSVAYILIDDVSHSD